MISDDSNVEGRDQHDDADNDEHHRPLQLQRLEQGRVHLLPVYQNAFALKHRLDRREDFTRVVRIVRLDLDLPTSSPSNSRFCASSIGMTMNCLS